MDVTSHFSEWRTACRMLWNETYASTIIREGGSFELEANFCEVERLLFDALVLMELDGTVRSEADRIGSHMIRPSHIVERFRIVPLASNTPVIIGKDNDDGGWVSSAASLSPGEADVAFVHCFDFCGMNSPRRYEYYLGKILGSGKFSEIVDKMILVATDLALIHDTRAERN